jgi:hypothetical protein
MDSIQSPHTEPIAAAIAAVNEAIIEHLTFDPNDGAAAVYAADPLKPELVAMLKARCEEYLKHAAG